MLYSNWRPFFHSRDVLTDTIYFDDSNVIVYIIFGLHHLNCPVVTNHTGLELAPNKQVNDHQGQD